MRNGVAGRHAGQRVAYVPGRIDGAVVAAVLVGIGIVGYWVLRGIMWCMYYAAAFFNPSLPWA